MKAIVPILALSLLACTSKKSEPAVPEPAPSEAVKAPDAPPAPDIRGEEVTYKAGDTTLKGYIAWDASKTDPRPGVIVIHEWWGHNEYVRKRARMLAEEGFTALAIDMYGDGKLASHPKDAEKFMMESINNAKEAAARFDAGLELLQAHASTDPTKTVAIGYCFGGAVALHMARAGKDLAGVASFHGNLGTETPAKPGAVKAQLLVLHGADDPFVPKEQLQGFVKEMDAAGANYEIVEYPGVQHSFTNPGATAIGEKYNLPLKYDKKADEESWAAFQKFLNELFPS